MSKDKKAVMSYENYEYDIRQLRGCEIVNWPVGVDMVRPSKMPAAVARDIRDGFKAGRIYWRRMSKAEHTELLAECDGSGSGSGGRKQRKTRSDKGTTRAGKGGGKIPEKGKGRAVADSDDDSHDESQEGSSNANEDDEDEWEDEDDNSQHPSAPRTGVSNPPPPSRRPCLHSRPHPACSKPLPPPSRSPLAHSWLRRPRPCTSPTEAVACCTP